MTARTSAYLTVYNDPDILELALRSVAPFVDELIVVDGAYEWMAGYYQALGQNPEKSDSQVYDAIEASGIPYRAISRLWSDQVEKRMAGYAACAGRYVCRIDADEVIFFHERELERFFSGNGAVGTVEMPTYIAPGWLVTGDGRRTLRNVVKRVLGRHVLPRQPFLFDSDRIPADIHLNYLWLVMQNLPRKGEKPYRVNTTPIGFNAHLTQWRSAANSARRAEYYALNYMRQKGVSWIPELRGKRITDFRVLFDHVDPAAFREIMLAARAVPARLKRTERVVRSPLSQKQEAIVSGCYDKRLHSLGELNRRMTGPGLHFTPNMPIIIDISEPVSGDPVTVDDIVLLEFSEAVSPGKIELYTVFSQRPWDSVCDLEYRSAGNFVAIRIPPLGRSRKKVLRRQIEFRMGKMKSPLVQWFKIRTERPMSTGLF